MHRSEQPSITGLEEETLRKILISLSNAKNFINIDEMRNVKAMCDSWDHSEFRGSARIKEALKARQREDNILWPLLRAFTETYSQIDRVCWSAAEKPRFANYMDDRRRRMSYGISSRNMDPNEA